MIPAALLTNRLGNAYCKHINVFLHVSMRKKGVGYFLIIKNGFIEITVALYSPDGNHTLISETQIWASSSLK